MAFDSFLKLEGIKGESTDDKHKDEIDILSFSWGVSQSGTFAFGGGGGAGKANFTDFKFTTNVSKASPNLMLACASGQHIKEATMVGERSSDVDRGASQFFKYTFTDVIISSYQDAGTQAGDVTDAAALRFASVKVEATPGATVGVAPGAIGNIVVDPKTGRPVEGGGQTGVLTSGPVLNLDGILIGLSRGVLEFSLKDVRGILNCPGASGLFFTCREFRQAQEQLPGDIINLDAVLTDERAVGPQKKLTRHDVYWYAPADLELTAEDFFRHGKKLGSITVDPSDPSGALAEAMFDLTEIAAANDSIGIRIQSAMDHTALMEEEGVTPEPDLDREGPPFTVDAARFTANLELVMG